MFFHQSAAGSPAVRGRLQVAGSARLRSPADADGRGTIRRRFYEVF